MGASLFPNLAPAGVAPIVPPEALPLDPLLKWPGGKRKVAPRIAALLPNRCAGIFREPFAGSASVFLHLRPRAAVLSDVNVGLINFHRVVRDAPDDLLDEARRLPLGTDWRDHYYGIRDAYNAAPREGAVQAARLLWLNRTAFNGLYRENASGGMNAPAGDYDTPALPSGDHVRVVSEAMQAAEVRVAAFDKALVGVRPDDHVYVDPPYDPLTRTASFATYSKGGFGWEDQERLAMWCAGIAHHGASVVASNHGTDRIIELWQGRGFKIETFEIKRSIGRTVESRGAKVTEILAWRGARGLGAVVTP